MKSLIINKPTNQQLINNYQKQQLRRYLKELRAIQKRINQLKESYRHG